MFAGAAREAVFANPEVIRQVNRDFIPVSVGAGLMHQPPRDDETRLLNAIGKSGPAPQGIAVLNSDGQALDWVLMFDDDDAVLRFLDHSRQRYKDHPDGKMPFDTRRFMRFSGQEHPSTAAHSVRVSTPSHAEKSPCPGAPRYEAGTVLTQVIGRKGGNGKAGEINQEDYAQDQFAIPPAFQTELADALKRRANKVQLPDQIGRLFASYAYMGMLDVRPISNPAGAKSSAEDVRFELSPVSNQSGWYRVTGTTHAAAAQQRRNDGAGFKNDVRLNWRGYLQMNGRALNQFALIAEGTEHLYWNPGGPGRNAKVPEVANLPGGRFIDWEGPVTFALNGKPVGKDRIADPSAKNATTGSPQARLQELMPKVRDGIQRWQREGRDMQPVGRRMNDFQTQMRNQDFIRAIETLDSVVKLLEGTGRPK